MAGIFLAIQLLPKGLPENKPMDSNHIARSGLLNEKVSTVLEISCYDCHSFQTRFPWYAKLAPASWFLADHIIDGREELNFSEWETYSKRKKIGMLDAISEVVESGEMPLKSYLLLHHTARLDTAKVSIIQLWTGDATGQLLE